MEQRKQQILMELMEVECVTGTQLARKIKMSTRTVRTLIKEIHEEIQGYGAHIEASKTLGYQLVIDQAESFLTYLQNQRDEVVQEDYNDQEQRTKYLFSLFMKRKDYVKLDDVCESLFISRTQLKQSLKILREYYAQYDLVLEHKPHMGMKLIGNELNRRLCIAHFSMMEDELTNPLLSLRHQEGEVVKTIENIMFSCIQNADYTISDDTAQNLLMHLFIAVKRMEMHQVIPLEALMLEKLKQESEYEIAQHMMTLLSQMFSIPYEESECGYITLHLCAKKASRHDALIIPDEVVEQVTKMLKYVRDVTAYDFTHDFHLHLALSQHIVPLQKRMEYALFMINPLLKEIKSKLLTAYEIAFCACEVLQEWTTCRLPEDEIAYFALHFNVAMERSHKDIVKRNILIVCSSGAGSAQLLKYHFMENFSSYIKTLDVCSAYALTLEKAKDYDYIFTTISLLIELPIPIIQIHHFIDQSDISLISEHLRNQEEKQALLSYFKKSLFFVEESYANKEEALSSIVARCRSLYELPDDYEQELLERECISSTEFNNFIVFPHSSRLVSDETFVSITVLKKPMVWTKHKIRIILFACIEKGSMKKLESFYKAITAIITHEEYQWQLLEKPEYATLEAILKELSL